MNDEIKVKDFSDKKIVIVDDDILNLKILTKILIPYKIDVEIVESGFELLKRIESGKRYDLIISDEMMPNLSGTDVLNKLKQDPNFQIPVVAFTANENPDNRQKFLEAGFDEFISKPISYTALDHILNRFLG